MQTTYERVTTPTQAGDAAVRHGLRLDATLLLADGTRFSGWGAGPVGAVAGELVFTTAMSGYQEALTDPSYRGQILVFTYPLIGNYGLEASRAQSGEVQAEAAVVATLDGSWAERASLRGHLLANRTPILYGVDTRAIVRHIRAHGAMPAALCLHGSHADGRDISADYDLRRLVVEAQRESRDLIAETTAPTPTVYGSGSRRIALLDCGNKRAVVEEMVQRDREVLVLPASTPAEEILALRPAGVVISNGPGDPAAATPTLQGVRTTITQLSGQVPLLGICLGHQLIALAAGGRTYKLAFGHRGANHPVQDMLTGRAFITTQNHGYAVDADSLPADLTVSHRNLNDGTVEGLQHAHLPIRTVQFHPEGAPGPRDVGHVLDAWLELAA